MHKFNLIENALDSLEHAIEHLNSINKDDRVGTFKRVILDLSHTEELLFKERLRRIHPAFVLSDVDKYPSSAAHTVTAAEALKRLQRIGGIEFEDADQSALKTIREKRNEIKHYEFEINEGEAKVIIGNVLSFIFRFSCDELDLDWAIRRLCNSLNRRSYPIFFSSHFIFLVCMFTQSFVQNYMGLLRMLYSEFAGFSLCMRFNNWRTYCPASKEIRHFLTAFSDNYWNSIPFHFGWHSLLAYHVP